MRAILDDFFHLTKNGTSVRKELIAGLTTFSTMAYIIIVNPSILSDAGMDFGSVMVATILASFLATLSMGLIANYPFALAPSMGLNAYFAYSIVQGQEHSWELGLGTCFIAGAAFLILTLVGIRQQIMHSIPSGLRQATIAGIGLFLAFIGLKNANIVIPHEATIVTVGNIADPRVVLVGLGVILIAALHCHKIQGSILIAILVNWLIGLATGLVEWKGVVDYPPSIEPTFMKMDVIGAFDWHFLPIILAFIFVAIFDTAGTLLGLAQQTRALTPEGFIPRPKRTLVQDAVGTMAGAALGTSVMTNYLESASGIAAGGKTGLTAVTVALLFLVSLFFSPIITSIPHFATAPALIAVGAIMMHQIAHLDWDDASEYIPAFIILITIPLTFSIATGIALGFITYPIIKLLAGKHREVSWVVWVIAALFCLKFAFE